VATPRIHYSDDRLAIASVPGLLVSVLRQPLTLEGANILRVEARNYTNSMKGQHVSLSVIEPTAASSPTPEVREVTTQLAKENKILGAGIVLEGSGFGPATTRAIIAGMYLIAKKEYPHKVFDSVETAAAWLPTLVGGVTRADVVAAAAATRAAIKRG
jgi:hypothetical protein